MNVRKLDSGLERLRVPVKFEIPFRVGPPTKFQAAKQRRIIRTRKREWRYHSSLLELDGGLHVTVFASQGNYARAGAR